MPAASDPAVPYSIQPILQFLKGRQDRQTREEKLPGNFCDSSEVNGHLSLKQPH